MAGCYNNIRASRSFCFLAAWSHKVSRHTTCRASIAARPIKAPRLGGASFVLSLLHPSQCASIPPLHISLPDSTPSNRMCFGGKGDTVVIRKRERPRYSRDYYVSRPEVASYRRETVTRRSTSAHRPSHDHHHHHDHGRSRSRSRITEERRSRTYHRD